MQHDYAVLYKNIELRPLCEADIEHLRIWRNAKENTRYLRAIPYITPEMQKNWYNGYLQNADEMIFAIIETESLNRLIGSLSLYSFSDTQAEFGKILIGDPQAHGRKAGLHATVAALKIGFGVLGLEKVILEVYEENAGALHVYQQAGFVIVDSHVTADGRRELRMEITKESFNA